MDIKIVCGCGQKYIFEVDPDNGLMGTSVTCPACGADGTQEANEILTQIFPEPLAESSAEPATEAVPPPPTPAEADPIRINPPVRLVAATSPPPPISVPRTIAPLKSPAAKPKLAWYEHVWAALPLCLVAVGGAIGGGIGGAAWVVNRAVFQKVRQPVLRYVLTGLISAAAVVAWLVLASVILGWLHKR
jgi:hypothetical protein